MPIRIILMLMAVAVPVLLGFASHAYRSGRLARFVPAVDGFPSRFCAVAHGLIGAWMLFGMWVVFRPPYSSSWTLILGLAGLLFGSFFQLTVSLLECFEGRSKPRVKPSGRLASNGPLWDAELDHGRGL